MLWRYNRTPVQSSLLIFVPPTGQYNGSYRFSKSRLLIIRSASNTFVRRQRSSDVAGGFFWNGANVEAGELANRWARVLPGRRSITHTAYHRSQCAY
jgi:hypothetical protein